MNPEFSARLQALRDPYCSDALLVDLYGLSSLQHRPLFDRYFSWSVQMGMLIGQASTTIVQRHYFESFMTRSKIIPVKHAALRLGMTVISAADVFERLAILGFPDAEYQVSCGGSVSEQYISGLHRIFPPLRYYAFHDHNDYCRRLHDAIASNLNYHIVPAWCCTSLALCESPPDYAIDLDSITLDTLGPRYHVWLDTGKPLSLRPDACSLLEYVRDEDLLSEYSFGRRPPSQLISPDAAHLRTRLTVMR